MIVWRVETQDHNGPFQNSGDFIGLASAILPNGQKIWNFSTDSHPPYYVDFRRNMSISRSSFFGCLSLEHLRKWFGYEYVIEYLKKHAFRVSKYECDYESVTSGHSGIQCVFDIISAIKLRDFPIEELLNTELI